MDEDLGGLSGALAKIEHGKIKAISDQNKVYLVIQDAPDQLRRLAAELERINVREIKALIAYINEPIKEADQAPALESSEEDPEPKDSE